MRFFRYLVLPFSILSIEFAIADSLTLDTVVVKAPRSAPDAIDLDYQTGSVSVIERDQFSGSVATVADVIEQASSVQVRQSGGLGSFASASIRGASSSQVNVFLDGLLINSAHSGVVDLSQFSLESVERIEVYRGRVPAHLGQAAIGGAINIVTRKEAGQAPQQLTLGAGSYETRKLGLALNHQWQATSVLFTSEHLESDNDYRFLNNQQTPDDASDDVYERRTNADLRQDSAMLSVQHQVAEGLDLTMLVQGYDKKQGIPTVQNEADDQATLESDMLLFSSKLDHWIRPGFGLSYSFSGMRKTQLYTDLLNQVDLEQDLEKTQTLTFDAKVKASLSLGASLISASLELRNEDVELDDQLLNKTENLDRQHWLLGLQNEWLSSSQEWLVTASAQVIGQKGEFSVLNDSDLLESSSESEVFDSYSLGALWQINPLWQWRINLSRDIRIPNLSERFGDNGFFQANDELKPETALNFDTGLSFKRSDFEVGGSVFARDLDDAIVMVFSSQASGQAQNIASARIFGLELDAMLALTEEWNLRAHISQLDTEDTSNRRFSRGNSLPGKYEFSARAESRWLVAPFEFAVAYEHESGGYYDTANIAPLPQKSQLHLNMKWRSTNQEIELSVKNLGDQEIADFNRYPGPGRRLFVTYKHNF